MANGLKKKSVATLLGDFNSKDEEFEEEENETDLGKIDIRVNAQRKFDIKQLKCEIWRILGLLGLPEINYESQLRTDKKRVLSFTDLMLVFQNHIDNEELLECLSVHQTFVCLLHLANENTLKFKNKNQDYSDFEIFKEVEGERETIPVVFSEVDPADSMRDVSAMSIELEDKFTFKQPEPL